MCVFKLFSSEKEKNNVSVGLAVQGYQSSNAQGKNKDEVAVSPHTVLTDSC